MHPILMFGRLPFVPTPNEPEKSAGVDNPGERGSDAGGRLVLRGSHMRVLWFSIPAQEFAGAVELGLSFWAWNFQRLVPILSLFCAISPWEGFA
jgi:hypothetical protein